MGSHSFADSAVEIWHNRIHLLDKQVPMQDKIKGETCPIVGQRKAVLCTRADGIAAAAYGVPLCLYFSHGS